jgi:hypothetical protein
VAAIVRKSDKQRIAEMFQVEVGLDDLPYFDSWMSDSAIMRQLTAFPPECRSQYSRRHLKDEEPKIA